MAPPNERRRRESSARRDRERDRDRETDRERAKRRSRPPSSRPVSRYADESTPESTPRARRHSRSQSQSRGGAALSAEALAALNSSNHRRSTSRAPREPDRTRERIRDRERERDRYEEDSYEAARASREARRAAREQKSRSRGDPYRDSREHRDSRDYRNSRDYGHATAGGAAYVQHAAQDHTSHGEETREERRARRRAEKAAAERHETDGEQWHTADEDGARRKKKKKRIVSGAVMEEGMAVRGGASRPESEEYMLNEKEGYARKTEKRPGKRRLNKKRIIIFGSVVLVLVIVLIAVAVVVAKKKKGGNDDEEESDINNIDRSSIPSAAQGTYLDPFTWYDTTDFNLTYTNDTVGDLPVMGLFMDWDDSEKANDNVPAIEDDWGSFGSRPARGVNLGGWLNLEPFITPSLFNYDSDLGIIDEWTLCSYLGDDAASTLEKHYATFVTEQTFSAIKDAGLDHVRIPYGYWAVETYDDDPYVFRTSWRYLLRGIEWARKYGLRVNLDIHGLPGSQNGWNHSGRQGAIGWLNGTDGDLNRQRSLDIHDRLSQFFAQDRYKSIITFYGLANEPKMTALDPDDVIAWTEEAYALVKGNGVDAVQVFGDGFMGLDNWQGKMTGYDDLALDVHQYVIFNVNQIVFTHQQKVQYACSGWTKQTEESMDTSTGYGPTLFAEWSQADTDCTQYLNNVGQGNRWEGTYDTGDTSTSVLEPRCPLKDDTCTCSDANSDPSRWSDEYKEFLLMFAEAQMVSFEKGWGWWYWTWDTESAPQWSYKAGLDAGVLPKKAYERDFNCDSDVPDFDGLPEYY